MEYKILKYEVRIVDNENYRNELVANVTIPEAERKKIPYLKKRKFKRDVTAKYAEECKVPRKLITVDLIYKRC